MPLSAHRQLLEAVHSAIVELSLEDIPDENVVIWKANKRQERVEVGSLPLIVVAHSDESEVYEGPGSTNIYNTVGYPIEILLIDEDRWDGKPDQELWHDKRLYWRERIVARFLDQSLAPACICTISTRPVFIPAEWEERSLWVSPLLLYFWVRTNTSLGALYVGGSQVVDGGGEQVVV